MLKFSHSRLKELRALKGLSADAFGAAIEKTGRTILNWEEGKCSPSGEDLATLGNVFSIDPGSLFVEAQ